jgi:5'-3' exonuclease
MATLLLDSPSLIFRAFFALPASITDEQGQPVNAVRGYLDMVAHLVRTEHPSDVVHCFDDDWRPQFRVDAYPGYKEHRLAQDGSGGPEEPDELTPQFGIINELLAAFGAKCAIAAGFEADDVIGTLADAATRDAPVAVVTGDRDLFQLVNDGSVMVLYTVKGVSELRRVDEADVLERYGIPAGRYADFAILRGDPSDGLPGIPGVGPKRAAALTNSFASIDELIAAAESQPERLRDAILSSREYLQAMTAVVPVRRDAPVVVTGGGKPDAGKLARLAAKYNLESPVERLLAALNA